MANNGWKAGVRTAGLNARRKTTRARFDGLDRITFRAPFSSSITVATWPAGPETLEGGIQVKKVRATSTKGSGTRAGQRDLTIRHQDRPAHRDPLHYESAVRIHGIIGRQRFSASGATDARLRAKQSKTLPVPGPSTRKSFRRHGERFDVRAHGADRPPEGRGRVSPWPGPPADGGGTRTASKSENAEGQRHGAQTDGHTPRPAPRRPRFHRGKHEIPRQPEDSRLQLLLVGIDARIVVNEAGSVEESQMADPYLHPRKPSHPPFLTLAVLVFASAATPQKPPESSATKRRRRTDSGERGRKKRGTRIRTDITVSAGRLEENRGQREVYLPANSSVLGPVRMRPEIPERAKSSVSNPSTSWSKKGGVPSGPPCAVHVSQVGTGHGGVH